MSTSFFFRGRPALRYSSWVFFLASIPLTALGSISFSRMSLTACSTASRVRRAVTAPVMNNLASTSGLRCRYWMRVS